MDLMEQASMEARPANTTSGSFPITRRARFVIEHFQPPPGLKSCLREFGLDWLAILCILVTALSIDRWVPDVGGNHRYFRVPAVSSATNSYSTASSFEPAGAAAGPSELDHPLRLQIIGFWLSAGLDVGIPGTIVVLLQLLCSNGSFVDGARAMLGVVNSILICCFIQVILKSFVGGFRPAFLETCRPQLGIHHKGAGYDGAYFRPDICTGDHKMISWGLESFPSGHVATSCAAAVFLSLYINARLKVFADYRANPLLVVFCLSPLVLASLMAGVISIDMSHHWYDILAGAILGTTIAILCYRNAYAAVLDHRWNHVPLSSQRTLRRSAAAGSMEAREREHGHGYEVGYGFPKFVEKKVRGEV